MAVTTHTGAPLVLGPLPGPDDVAALVEPATALARRWVAATAADQTAAEKKSAGQLAALVELGDGLDGHRGRAGQSVQGTDGEGVTGPQVVRQASHCGRSRSRLDSPWSTNTRTAPAAVSSRSWAATSCAQRA